MTGALRAIIIAIGAIIVLIASQVNLLWSLLLLLGAAGTSVWYWWRLRDSEKHKSLYDEAPTIRPIRGRQSPQRLSLIHI
jgi:membrane protein implicated in regulation of membrane protease activity